MASRCEDGTVTGDFLDELPNFHIDTFSELEEYSGRFTEVSESDVEKFIEGEENANTKKKTFYDLKLVKKFLIEKRHEIREIENIPPTELDSYLSQLLVVIEMGILEHFSTPYQRELIGKMTENANNKIPHYAREYKKEYLYIRGLNKEFKYF